MGIKWDAVVSGGIAGVSVDIALFPLDTIKTRMQSPHGFLKSGGFRGVYNGLFSAAAGSFPNSALFFCVYETSKPVLREYVGESNPARAQTLAGALGEVFACLIRVPTENVKQKLQAGQYQTTKGALRGIVAADGVFGFYSGYLTTIMREVPFSMIQFPIWEALKMEVGRFMDRPNQVVMPWESAACGSFSGAFAAALTTPLDVIKTRLMLRVDVHGVKYNGLVGTFMRVVNEEGAGALLSGITPRVMWIGIGGFVYFGAYEQARRVFVPMLAIE